MKSLVDLFNGRQSRCLLDDTWHFLNSSSSVSDEIFPDVKPGANESKKTRNKKQNGLAHLGFIVCVTPKQKKHCLIQESFF